MVEKTNWKIFSLFSAPSQKCCAGLYRQGRAFSTIKVYIAPISACHVGFGRDSLSQHPLVSYFIKGALQRLFVSKPLLLFFDLWCSMRCQQPFETLNEIDLKSLSFKLALLLELSTAKQVIEMHISSPDLWILLVLFPHVFDKVFLVPNPSIIPEVKNPPYRWVPVQSMVLGFTHVRGDPSLHRIFRRSNQPFVSLVLSHLVKPISKLTWICVRD